ncbi:MAG: hypothetical protein JWN44_4172 [Myxococcales bacterium]|nr:hypothetical protein [Myxococcales bacterium]
MGLRTSVENARPLGEALVRLAAAGAPSQIVMVDGALVMPGSTAPARWADVRLKTPAGTLALKQEGHAVAVVVFGNADAALLAMQQKILDALAP